jgi:squalene-hopene/tetraprenyl-beta-curcumene cyclase
MRTADSGPRTDTRARARAARDAASAHLLAIADPAGWWNGELETNVTMDAEDLLMRQFLGVRTAELTQAVARRIRAAQRPDGTWANGHDAPADLSTTIEAYVALRLAGDGPDEPWMVRAREFVLAGGGIERSRVFTRIWLALFGAWPWDRVPVMPPEMIFLPPWFPLNIYDWGCWARQTIVPLTILSALRPRRPLPIDLSELRTGLPDKPLAQLGTWTGAFQRLDMLLHRYQRRPLRLLRKLALRRAAEWIIARQEADGCWGGIQPPWVYSMMALHTLGYSLEHPVLRAGLAGLERYAIVEDGPDGPTRRLQACTSPVWDTALAMVALRDAGVSPQTPQLQNAAEYLLREEVRVRGDWAVRRPGLQPGGWAFEFDNDGYPDIDDTAEVLLALRKTLGRPASADAASAEIGRAAEAAIERGLRWMAGMQSSDGGWGAFDADNTRTLCTKLPFCDFGAVIDPPTADVTAHVVEALCEEGRGDSVEARRGVRWLREAQEKDGSWWGRWGVNYVYGTGAVVPALIKAGVSAQDPAVRRAVRWLGEHQNQDGGWGESLRSYDDPSFAGRGGSTASQTAWALLALLAAGERGAVVEAGIGWLVDTQRPDGTWDEPEFTGTGFPGDFYLNYHLYRLVFPLTALGRYLGGTP